MGFESIAINACITIFSFGLFTVSILSYHKYKNTKLLFVSLVFLFFLIKGVVLSLGLFIEQLAGFLSNPYIGIFDLAILILLFIATLKR
jgi:hypothetical protein